MTTEMDGEILWRLKQNEAEIAFLKEEIQAIESRNRERDAARAELERRQLVYGISFLGGVIMSLVTVIWNFRSVILK